MIKVVITVTCANKRRIARCFLICYCASTGAPPASLLKNDPAQSLSRFLNRHMPGAFELENSGLRPEASPHADGSFDGAECSGAADDVNRAPNPRESPDPVNRAQHSQIVVRSRVINGSKRNCQIGRSRPMSPDRRIGYP